MKYIEVNGADISSDIALIQRTLAENSQMIFLYVGGGTIHDYIHALYNGGRGLDDEALYKFRVCYANEKLNISLLYRDRDGASSGQELTSMSRLIEVLDGETDCRIVVNSNSREELSFIVQQLIFIQYPLEKIDILLRQEERDADKVRRFQQRVDELVEKCGTSLKSLEKLIRNVECEAPDAPSHAERLSDANSALESCKEIGKNLEKARNVELKLAVAASKKTGKSVIVNSFIGEEVAPTDVQLATPNNCIYQKSPDNSYHLRMDADEHHQAFDKAYDNTDDIRRDIEDLFRAAQNDKAHGFALPDMHIGYRAAGNNFSSYTIYDTAGPDAAGTSHKEVARRAMNKCDVAVFGIDYGKYLTISEAEYLKEVKGIFQSQQKVHSLLFALNKIDTRYTDPKQSKSVVEAVDFIKTRLADIADEYRDCIIFPTCSLEYFCAVEAENAGVTELNKPVSDMKKVKFDHRDVPVLNWLHTHSENLEYYHGIEQFSYDVFKRDSGMPALMSYVSYVATSKARDEIINHVAFEIDQQNQKLHSILNTVSNLEELISADEDKIREIKRILDSYVQDITQILTPTITQDDLNALPARSLLRDSYRGNLETAKKKTKDWILNACSRDKVLEQAYTKTAQKMWEKLKPYANKDIDNSTLNNVMTSLVSREEINETLQKLCDERRTKLAGDSFDEMKKIRSDIIRIGENRQTQARARSERAKSELAKQNVHLQLPQLPDMQFSAPLPKPDTTAISVTGIIDRGLEWNDLFNEHYSGGQFAAAIFTLGLYALFVPEGHANKLKVNREGFLQICGKRFKPNFENALMKSNVSENMQRELERVLVDTYVNGMIHDLKKSFDNMTSVQQQSIDQFSAIIDDREKYKAHIDQMNARKDNIHKIQDSTKGFMDVWNVVVNAVDSDTSPTAEGEE